MRLQWYDTELQGNKMQVKFIVNKYQVMHAEEIVLTTHTE